MEDEYVGSYIDPKIIQDYDEIICTWYSFIEKAGSVSGINET